MAQIVPTPLPLNDVVLQVGADNYEASVSKVQLDPTVVNAVWRGMTPSAVIPVVGSITWALTIDYAQDFTSASALANYLFSNAGTTKTIIFKPKKPTTTGPTWTVTAVIQPGPIGGELDSIAKGSVTLQVVGQPALTTA